MKYTDFFSSIKAAEICGAYLLCGEEEYILLSAIKAVKASYSADMGAMNIDEFDSAAADDIIGASETLPFIAEKRVIICNFIPNGSEAEKLISYFARIPSSSIILFCVRGKCDARLAIYKNLNEKGRVIKFDYLDGMMSAKWAMKRAMDLGCTLDSTTAKFLVELCGCSCSVLNNELHKLCALAGESGCINKNMVSSTVTRNFESTVFVVLDYFINGKVTDGMDTLKRQLLEGETSIGISKLFLNSIMQMIAVRSLAQNGSDNATIKKETGLRFDRTIAIVKRMSDKKAKALMRAATALCDVAPLQLYSAISGDDALVHALLLLAE